MTIYDINPLRKPKPYLRVRLNERRPDMIQIGSPSKGFHTLIDCRAGPELIMAINNLCREAGHAYIPGLGEQE